MFKSSIKREIRHFPVEFVQWRQRNVPKSLINVQRCVLLIQPIACLTFSLSSPSCHLKVLNNVYLTWVWGVSGGKGEKKSKKKIERRERNFFPLSPLPHLRFPLPEAPEEGLIRTLTCTPLWHALINNYSSSPNGLWLNSPWGRRPNGLLSQRPWGREE